MNTLSHIIYDSCYYCFCKEGLPIKCPICKVSEVFGDFEIKLGEHIFHYNYLKKYYDQLFLYLMKMFHLKNETVCCFLHQEYQLKGQDWCTGGHGVVRFLTVFI